MFKPISSYEERKSSIIHELECDTDEEDERSPELPKSTLYSSDRSSTDTIADFEKKTILGMGSFGKVFLVQKKGTEEVFAMK